MSDASPSPSDALEAELLLIILSS